MKVLFYTYGLFPGRERLMPWRSILEVAKEMLSRGFSVEILTDLKKNKTNNYFFYNEIKIIPINNYLFLDYIQNDQYNILFYPVAWRDGLKSFEKLEKVKIRKIAYFPGGVYAISNILALMKYKQKNIFLPYLLESIVPKSMIIKKLRKAKFEKIIAFSDYTANKIKKAGGVNVTSILPGKDNFNELEENIALISKYKLKHTKYFLFLGAPAVTRGSLSLLKAFDIFAGKQSDAKIIFLMRKDLGSSFSEFFRTYERMKNKKKVIIINDNLLPSDLKSFVINSWATVLPFLVIPSEIPLTFFEVLSCGIPIITFRNGGSSYYMKDSILVGRPGKISDLSQMLFSLWNNANLRNKLSENAIRLISGHPTWDEVANRWINIVKKVE